MEDLTKNEKEKYFYYQIIQKEGDYIGRIAYTLYKKNKIDFIVNFKNKNNGEKPSDAQLEEWQENECLPNKIESYKKEAERITNDFVNILRKNKETYLDKRKRDLDQREEDIKDKTKNLNRRENNIKQREKFCQVNKKGAFGIGLLQNIIASFIFIFICWLILVYGLGNSDLLPELLR